MTEDNGDQLFVPIAAKLLASGTDDDNGDGDGDSDGDSDGGGDDGDDRDRYHDDDYGIVKLIL